MIQSDKKRIVYAILLYDRSYNDFDLANDLNELKIEYEQKKAWFKAITQVIKGETNNEN